MRTVSEVVHAFTPVGKLDPSSTQRILRLEVAFRELATEVYDLVPESADRTSALRKLLESKMTCVQAVSHGTTVPVQEPNPSAAPKEKTNNGNQAKSKK